MMDVIAQVGIAVFGMTSIWFVGRRETWRRWGFILGCLGQPFWFYATWTHKQWGIFALAFFYTYSWLQGVYNYWIRKDSK